MNHLITSLRATIILALITCGFYPLLITGIAKAAFKDTAKGSLVTNQEGQVIGSTLLGQNVTSEKFFHPRPSAAGAGYDGASSSGSNLGPTSQKLNDFIKERIAAYRSANGLGVNDPVPADAVSASGSGLDPHISPRNAELQAGRIAKARGLAIEVVRQEIVVHTEGGFLGEPGVNVLMLNLSLDRL